ncbi:MAG: hypothetical protein HYU68_02355, partial [Bacteroidetes bacterium]|nr:hypothetical protein [Bacteroidota bacterium]
MKKNLFLIVFLFLISTTDLLAGGACFSSYPSTASAFCTSPVITQDGACVAGTNVGLTACLSGGCLGALSQDFMQFTATSTSVNINFTSTGISTADVALITNSADGCGGSDASSCPTIGSLCIESCNTSVGVGSLSIPASGLTIGVTYYLLIESSAGNSGTFNICVVTNPCGNGIQDGSETGVDCGGSCTPCPATNDDCSDAIDMTLDVTEAIGSGASNTCTQTLCTDADTEDCYIATGPGCNPGCCLYSYMSCGSVENNTWYTYTPSVTDVYNFALQNQICSNGDGMQLWIGTLPSACNNDASTYNEIYCQSTATPADINYATTLTAGVTYYITLDGWAGDNCTFDFGVYGTNPLPVKLSYFNGKHENGKVVLDWVTETEINNDYFTIERAKDNLNYEAIGTVIGAGNSNTTKKYLKEDNNLQSGIYYYRLKQTDFDGQSKFVGEIVVRISDLADFVLAPNITSADTKIDMFLSKPTYVNISIVDISGKVVFEEKKELPKGTASYAIPSSDFAEGTYDVNIHTGDE